MDKGPRLTNLPHIFTLQGVQFYFVKSCTGDVLVYRSPTATSLDRMYKNEDEYSLIVCLSKKLETQAKPMEM